MNVVITGFAGGAIAVLAWIGYQLVLQNGRILLQLKALHEQLDSLAGHLSATPGSLRQPSTAGPSLQMGSRAPEFELPDLGGRLHRLSDWHGRKVLLMFFNPGCGFCRDMARKLKDLQPEDAVLPVVISTGPAEENGRLIQENNLKLHWLLQDGIEVSSQYAASGTPMGYLIDERGLIASALKVGATELLEMLQSPARPSASAGNTATAQARRDLSRSKIKRDGLSPGTMAPEFVLPRIDGGELRLSAFVGRKMLLIFSDPGCAPCQTLSARLNEAWSSQSPVAVLMVSRGTPEENRRKVEEHRLGFPVVLQRKWEISRLYAFFATPMGYLIDEDGRIATDVAIGVEPIMALWEQAARETSAAVAQARVLV